jgi:hypothetical protein
MLLVSILKSGLGRFRDLLTEAEKKDIQLE